MMNNESLQHAPAIPAQPPPVMLGESDYDRLSALADMAAVEPGSAVAFLAAELDRATIVADDELPGDVVAMHRRLAYRADDGAEHQAMLVFPRQADIAANRVSILTPVGAALIGLRTGASIVWRDRMGRERHLTVTAVG